MLKSLIVDDAKLNRDVLKHLIQKYLPQVSIVGMASSAEEALELIRLSKPDLVFLDIEMPGASGFDLINMAAGFDFAIIFVTAYDEYAVKAFKVSAVDYLLKPINIDELIQAVNKVELLKPRFHSQQISFLQDLLNSESAHKPSRMAITTPEGLRFVYTDDLIRLEADGKYTRCYVRGEKAFLSSKNLGEFEKILNPDWFFRVHNSHLISLQWISTFSREDQEIILEDETRIPVSQRRRGPFLKRFKMI